MLYWLFTGGARIAVYTVVPSLVISGLALLLSARVLGHDRRHPPIADRTKQVRRLRRLSGGLAALSTMQLVILIYHMTGASHVLPVYMHIRVLVSSYVFLNGYGHFFSVWMRGDTGLYRFLQVKPIEIDRRKW